MTQTTTESQPEQAGDPKWPLVLWIAGLLWLGVVFSGGVFNPLSTWDDPVYVVYNPLVQDWWGQPWLARLLTPNLGYPAPLPVALYAATRAMFASLLHTAWAIHTISLLVHLLNFGLVVSLSRKSNISERYAVIVGALWAAHPLVVEGVSWATNLKEVCLTCGVLLSVLAWDHVVRQPRKIMWVLALMGSLGVALASKPVGVIAPALWIAWSCGVHLPEYGVEATLKRALPALIPLGAVCAGWWLMASRAHAMLLDAGSTNALADRPLALTMLDALGLQLTHYAWPTGLNPYYLPSVGQGVSPRVMVGALACVVWGGAMMWAVKFKRAQLGVALGFALVCWLPYSNLAPLPRFTSDTYMYLCSVGVVWCGVLAARAVYGELVRRTTLSAPRARAFVLACAAVLIVAWGALSISQTERWSSARALWGPMLGQPEVFAMPYGLVAYEAYLGRDDAQMVELLEASWPYMKAQRALPGFAPQALMEAGKANWAAKAALDLFDVGAWSPAQTRAFMTQHRLSAPPESRAIADRLARSQ